MASHIGPPSKLILFLDGGGLLFDEVSSLDIKSIIYQSNEIKHGWAIDNRRIKQNPTPK